MIHYFDSCDIPEIIDFVKKGGDPPFRPHIPEDHDVPEKALRLMAASWQETPEHRIEFNIIRKRLLDMNSGK